MTGGRLLADTLSALNAGYVWGCSGHTNIAALDALIDSDVHYISVRHEQVAAHAADGYFRATHRPGVVLLHNGPGLSNAITGLGDAAMDCSAVLAISGDVALRHEGRDAFQEIGLHADASQGDLVRPIAKRVWRVHSADQLPDVIVRAWSEAVTGRPGVALVNVPMDVFSARSSVEIRDISRRMPTGARIRGDQVAIDRAMALLTAATRPLIHAGGGVGLSEAEADLLTLAEYLGIPVTTTMAGKGSISELHLLSAGTTGRAGTPVANKLALEADVVLAIGTQFPEQDSSSWAGRTFTFPPSVLIHVDIDPRQIGKIYPTEVGIVGDAKAVLADLLAAARDRTAARDWKSDPRIERLARDRDSWWSHLARQQCSNASPIRPERVLHEIRESLPAEGTLFGDVGWGKNGVSQQYLATAPRTTMVASGYGTMGFAAAAALGAKAGRPGTPVVSLTGDGGMSSVLSSIVTAVEYDLSVVWVVFNNGSYSAIQGLQNKYFGRSIGGEFVRARTGDLYDLNFADIALSIGAKGRRVSDPNDLRAALNEALQSDCPFVLDVVIDRTAIYEDTGYWDVAEMYNTGRTEE